KKVTKRTIINSLAKAGILPDDNDSNISDNKSDDNNFEDNIEEIQLLIDELPTINPLSIEEYINIDDKLIAEEELSLEEIIDIVKTGFIKASELLNSKNNTTILDELKDKFTHMQNAQLIEIHKETSKSFNSKEIYDHPCFSRFEEFVKSTQPDIDLLTLYDKKLLQFYQELFKAKESFNIHEDYEFKAVCDTLHTRIIELEEINNSDYNGADPLTDEEIIQIFEYPNMSNNTSDGLLRRVFLWIGYYTAQR
ncbi:1917_t:CDS:2, partial [Funneliformis geosporum]